ncbi:MAG: porin [Paracoccus sp. (in: a-proteobacteria)]|uniref:porin n=1 Tax=Paracoccus sp. TaxID=267 RepID=UPI0026DED75C|nr:porin [Paracoccus sp. (in: a-proteobacteria)]MDO5631994.1 porin [Paracoccus sp. (in: a-proteobacteria)]
MKKALFASTALVLSAGVAAADITLSGYGRTALSYHSDPGDTVSKTHMQSRVRLNIHATTSSDIGVDFGARFRIQWDQGDTSTGVNPGQIYATYQGATVQIGNVYTAFDEAGLIYESEIGLLSRSFGNPLGEYYAYSSKSYGTYSLGEDEGNRMGLAGIYSVGDLTARVSYVEPNQRLRNLPEGTKEELGVSVDYKWNDLQLSAAAVQNGGGYDNNDQYFVGAYYTMPGTDNGIGLNWNDNGDVLWISQEQRNLGKSITLYGDYVVAPQTTLSAYIAHNDGEWAAKETDNAFGIGFKYDLGGAYLAGAVERGYEKETRGDLGVRFNF